MHARATAAKAARQNSEGRSSKQRRPLVKTAKAAHENDLPPAVLAVIDGAKKYAEGRGVRLEVKTAEDVHNIEKLVVIKMSN